MIATADIDGDGDLDVLVSGHASGTIGWWENTAGSGATWSGHALTTGAPLSWAVATADLDDDGDLDIVGTSIANSKLIWWENDGSTCGPSCSWTERVIDGFFGFAQAVVVADLDEDGDLDVIGGSQAAGIAWWENETIHRSAAFGAGLEVASLGQAARAIVADVDGDGDLDVVATGTSTLLWAENLGAGLGWTVRTLTTTLVIARGVAAGDIDADGDLDIVVTSALSGEVLWFENDGSPTDGGWLSHLVISDFSFSLWAEPADLDGDGDLDLGVSGGLNGDHGIWWLENDGSPGDGIWNIHSVATGISEAMQVAVGDLDEDGDLDLAASSSAADFIVWFESDGSPGDGGWLQHTIVENFLGAVGLQLCDLDRDGDLDVVGVAGTDDDVAWFENDGTPSDPLWTRYDVADSFTSPAHPDCADIDDDGDLDLVVASAGLDLVSVFVGDGSPLDGGWQRLDLATDAQGPQISRAGDLDGDGRADVLVADGLANSVRWWPNVGGQFALPTTDLVANSRVVEGVADVAVLRIDGLHRGRPSDDGAEISTLELLLEEAPGDPLTGSELDTLVENLRLYLDDGDGTFDPQVDTAFFALGSPFALTDGVMTLTMVDDDPNVQLAVGSGKTFFLSADLAVDAGSATPNRLRVTHVISSSSTGEMATTDIPLRLEDSGDVTSTGIEILPSEIFADGFESGDTTLWSAVTP